MRISIRESAALTDRGASKYAAVVARTLCVNVRRPILCMFLFPNQPVSEPRQVGAAIRSLPLADLTRTFTPWQTHARAANRRIAPATSPELDRSRRARSHADRVRTRAAQKEPPLCAGRRRTSDCSRPEQSYPSLCGRETSAVFPSSLARHLKATQ